MPEYTLATAITMLVVVCVELFWLRTRIFRSPQYWISLAIVFGFQVLVDGWLTKLSDPIVIYNPDTMLGVRWPWDIPIEDFGFGFAMITLALVLWRKLGERQRSREAHEQQPSVTVMRGRGHRDREQ